MKISSLAFEDDTEIPSTYAYHGQNFSPPLEWSDVPEGTQSLALVVDDPDASAGVWTHWMVWNIPPGVDHMEAGKLPAGALEGTNSSEKREYDGPAPPSGTHHYRFKLYALDTVLNLPQSTHREEFERAIMHHILSQIQLVGLYHAEPSAAHVMY